MCDRREGLRRPGQGVSGDRGREKGWPREQSWTRLKRSGQTGQGEGCGGGGAQRGPGLEGTGLSQKGRAGGPAAHAS